MALERQATIRLLALALIFIGYGSFKAMSQQPPVVPRRASSAETLPIPDQPTVKMTLQGDVRLDALVGFVSQRMGIKFEYNEKIASRLITLRSPEEIPVSSLPSILGSVLRTQQLALVDSNTPGWKRIVEINEINRFAAPGNAMQAMERNGPASVVTQVFVIKDNNAKSIGEVLTPFLSSSEAKLIPVPESNVVIVTDYATNVKTMSDILELIDRPAGDGAFQVYVPRFQSAQVLSEQARGVLDNNVSARTEGQQRSSLHLVPDPLGKRIVIAGTGEMVKRAMQLLQRLDVSLGLTTQVYRIRNTNAERIDKLIKGFVEPPNDQGSYQTTVDEQGNLLIVRASEEVHRQVVKLIAELDTAVDTSESPIQFYKLKNASALDVLYSLLALQEAYGTGGFNSMMQGSFYGPFGGSPFGPGAFPGMGYPFAGNSNAPANVPLPLPPVNNREALVPSRQNPLARPTTATGPASNVSGTASMSSDGSLGTSTASAGISGNAGGMGLEGRAAGGMPGGAAGPSAGFGGGLGGGMGGSGGVASLPGGARVSADIATNSLIVYAPANVQPLYAKLIESLDQRRPQVLIEAQVIAVDTSDDYTLGVEVSTGDREGARRLFKFTSFGLSEVNRDTGNLRVIPGLGFNGTLIDPDVADVVVRALASHTRARVLAAPKILVNDNSTGKLESVTSVPFSSINASQTVSTTSLGGNQQAGTIITATPHINEDNHLQLDFDVEFSTFSGTATAGLPPARQIDRVGSTVTIPDGKTVVVGGLKRTGDNYSYSGLPWAEKIPILRDLTGRTDTRQSTMSFFLFIRPVVLRDSRFADLRYLSDKEANKSAIAGEYPTSQPELIR
jgi:general secretion pathway protein D